MQVVSDLRRGDYVYYRCPCRYLNGDIPADCARSVRINRTDADIWQKVWEVISVPGRLEALVEARIAALQNQEQDAEREIDRLNERLGALAMERQRVITGWRKGKMTEQDYDTQIAVMNFEQADLEGQLSKARLAAGGQSVKLAEFGQWYRQQAAAGLQALNEPPINAEDHRRQFALKRKFVETIVHRVDVAGDKSATVTAEFDLSGFLGVSPAATYQATCPPHAWRRRTERGGAFQ
jgi:hypothetical protein